MSKDNDNDNEYGIDGGWIGVAICLALFWPVGLILLIRKLRQRKRGRNESKQMSRAGISLIAAGVIMAGLELSGWGVPTAIIGGVLLGMSKKRKKREQRYMRYLAIVGGRPSMSIYDVASTIPVPAEQALRELQDMIDQGYFGMTAYIDRRAMRIVLDGSVVEDAGPEVIYVEPDPDPEPAQYTYEPEPPHEEKKEEKKANETTDSDDQYSRWIKDIREVNDRIADEVISAKIDRIETATTHIFELVRSRPDKQPQIRKFMNYYLPTTLKLLDSYALLEAQGIEGENITASKQQIESIMDTLIQGFEKQLDMLFSAQKMDINSDIEVLENMMAADGLKENEFRLPRNKREK